MCGDNSGGGRRALFQFGFGDGILNFAVYLIIQALVGGEFAGTGTFAEAVNLSLVIILSVVIFGGLCRTAGCFRHSGGDAGRPLSIARPDGPGDRYYLSGTLQKL